MQEPKKERDELLDRAPQQDELVEDEIQENTNTTKEQLASSQEKNCVKELQEQLNQTIKERDEYLLLAQRAQADFDNYRRRNKTAIAEAFQTATMDTIEALLPVLDNLERALESAQGNSAEGTEAFIKGIEMVVKQFTDVLKNLGVEEIQALGEVFDPQFHNAVMKVETEEDLEENTIVEVLKKGYKYKDKVIRYSMVKVVM